MSLAGVIVYNEFCEDKYNNITAAKYDYSETIMELKAGAIDSQKVIALLDELIETINGEITAGGIYCKSEEDHWSQ